MYKNIALRIKWFIEKKRQRKTVPVSAGWALLERRISAAKKVVDLGCGANPHPKATVAVDAYVDPLHRGLGSGPTIDLAEMKRRNVTFINSDIMKLPFADKEFDFAYSHHVFEHLPDPKAACLEMSRIASAGCIVTPSVFAELAFGRPYHLWLVMARGHRLIFMKKLPEEDRPFGPHPEPLGGGKFRVTQESNPFDLLFNYGGWYRGRERMPRLERHVKEMVASRSVVMSTVFHWQDKIDCTVIDENGDLR